MFFKQLTDPIIILLLSASVLSIFLGDLMDALIIFVIVFISATLAFFQEYNASKAMEELSSLVKAKITLLRDGTPTEIEVEDVVPGDILILNSGDILPADGRFISTNDLTVNEAVLTGESFPVEKEVGNLEGDVPLAKRSNSGYMGSNVVSGTGKMIITATGRNTYFGGVAKDLQKQAPMTEFKKGLNRFGRLLMTISVVMILLIFFLNLTMHKNIFDSLMFAISLAVGITPQLLPAISSVNLSLGAKRMA